MKERAGVNGGQERLKEIYIERLSIVSMMLDQDVGDEIGSEG